MIHNFFAKVIVCWKRVQNQIKPKSYASKLKLSTVCKKPGKPTEDKYWVQLTSFNVYFIGIN